MVTNTRAGQLAELEVRHRLRPRCQGTASAALRRPARFALKRSYPPLGLDRFPLQGHAANRIWCLIVALARDILAFSQMFALAATPARRWEPRTIRLRLMSVPAAIAHHVRRVILRYKADHP